jgi:hypothetical protein
MCRTTNRFLGLNETKLTTATYLTGRMATSVSITERLATPPLRPFFSISRHRVFD